MERFTLELEPGELPDPLRVAQEILERRADALEAQPLIRTVAETDGLTPLLQLIIQPALPFI